MRDFLPFIIAGSVLAGLVVLRGGYVVHYNLNDPEEHYNIGSKYNDNSLLTGFFKGVDKEGGGNKTKHRKHKRGKNTRRK